MKLAPFKAAALGFSHLASAYLCSTSPIVLAIQNGTLYQGIAVNRGITFLCFPSDQKISLRPSFIWNSKYSIHGSDFHQLGLWNGWYSHRVIISLTIPRY